ncbi:MAG: hypothetical protein DMF69_24725, partial [Acidobacteria bacterium]
RYAKFANTIEVLKRLSPSAKTLLDVGAATGDLVRIARDRGLEAEGIELSAAAIKMANDLNSIKLERLALAQVEKDGFYDCIHLNHVFEHFNQPVQELRHIHRLLRTGGLLYIEIPYQFNAVEKWLYRLKPKSAEFSLHSLHHPFFYTPGSILRLLRTQGFQVMRTSVFDLKRYEANTLPEKIKKNLWWALGKLSIGTYIEVYARKS